MSTTTVCVVAMTGRLGSKIVQNLLLHPSVQVRGLCRDKSKVPESLSSNPRLSIVQGNSDDRDAARSAVRGCSAVVCCYLGSNELMTDGQKVLIDACVAENVPRYIASDYTLDYTLIQPTDIPAKEPMFLIREYLQGKPVQGVHVLNGVFVETWLSFLGTWRPKEYKLTYWGTGDEKWEMTTYDDTARYVAEVALDPNANGILKFRGDFLSPKQMAALLKEKYGESPALESKGTLDELLAKCDEARKGDVISHEQLLYFYTYYVEAGKTYMGDKLDNSRYPAIKPASLKDFMQKVDVKQMEVFG